jgi:hypothetical protein
VQGELPDIFKLLGESIAVSRDGKVVILPPEEIPDFPEDDAPVQ